VRGPLAGLAWHYLQYVIGLTQLGHEVFYIEDSDDYPSCYNPETNSESVDPSYGLRFLSEAFAALGLDEAWAYYDAHQRVWHGPLAGRVESVCASADLCINVSAVNPLRPPLLRVPVRAFVDTDPAFTQVRHLTSAAARERATRHTAFWTFAENLPTARSSIPADGFRWRRTRQPIVLERWPVTAGSPDGRLTSVLIWEAYPGLEHEGRRYGTKGDSFRPLLDRPAAAGPVFELACGSYTEAGELMERHGWSLIDPREPTRTLDRYQRFIQASKAEFSVAKHGYVESWSGWFSERSAAYLASGRPVIAQNTGFSEWMEVGQGVLPFSNREQALAAIEALNRDYERHCLAARRIAEQYFDARTVLARLVEDSMNAAI
jgi:hypothetical protein